VAADGSLLAEAVSEAAGGAHAEVVALAKAGEQARGATVYVTLEPCDHYGRTPPCTTGLLAAGVGRVVYAIRDVNPVAGGGAATLSLHGVTVDGPLEQNDPLGYAIRDDLAGFFTAVTANRPYVTLKMAQQSDGNTQPDATGYLTNPHARRSVHRMRQNADAVLVGSGTVIADNPQLTVRDVGNTHQRSLRQPVAAVFDRRLTTPVQAAVCRAGTLLVTTTGHDDTALAPYRRRGVDILAFAPTGANTGDVHAALATLAKAGVNDVFAEPGLALASALLAADAVDQLVLHVAGLLPDAAFTSCLPLHGFVVQARGTFLPNDASFTFVSDRKNA